MCFNTFWKDWYTLVCGFCKRVYYPRFLKKNLELLLFMIHKLGIINLKKARLKKLNGLKLKIISPKKFIMVEVTRDFKKMCVHKRRNKYII